MERDEKDKEICQLLGVICANFESLTFLLRSLISKLISEDKKIGPIVTAEMSFSNLINALKCLFEYKFQGNPELIKKLLVIVKLLNNSESARNKAIHSIYVKELGKSEWNRMKVTAKQKTGLKFTKEDSVIEALKETNNNLIVKSMIQIQELNKIAFGDDKLTYG